MLSTWSAVGEDGRSAGWARRQLGWVLLGLAVLWLACAGAVTAAPATDKVLRLRVLVLSARSDTASLGAIQKSLDFIGLPYDTWIIADHPGAWQASVLAQGNLGYYCAVLLADGQLVNGGASAFSAAEWQVLWDYTSTFGVREVAWYTYPTAEYGFDTVESLGAVTTDAILAPAAVPLFSYLTADTPVTIKDAWVYGGEIADDATPLLEDATGRGLAAHKLHANGRETIALTFDSSIFTRHHKLLAYGLINWATRGVFRGERRVYMGPQIDDVMIDALLVDGSTYRMTGADWDAVVAWQTGKQATAQFANFRYYMVFNGEGKDGYDLDPDTLMPAISATKDLFYWINHTFDHENLDSYSYSMGLQELQLNHDVALSLGFTTYDRRNMVTPEISGLANPNFMQAAYDFGLRYMVSDASKAGQKNPRPNVGYYHALQPAILMLPRYATNIFYECSTPEEQTDRYNQIYGAFWGRDLTYAEIIEIESEVLVGYMLDGDVNPWMFHQGNLRAYDGVHSILSDTLDATMAKYQAYYNLPVVCPPMQDLGATVAARMACDAAPVEAFLVGGREVVLGAPRAVGVPLTGVAFGPDQWTYGGQQVSRVALAPAVPQRVPLAGGDAAPGLTLTVSPLPLAENGGAAAGTLTVRRQNVALAASLTVNLTAFSPRFTVPAAVVIPAGGAEVTVAIGTTNNALDDGYAAGLLLGVGGALVGATLVTVADDEAPRVTAVAVSGNRLVDVTFSEPLGASALAAGNYTLSGSGQGTLAVNPNSVVLLSGSTYRLTWTAGEMFIGGDLTITVNGISDAAGNAVVTANSATHVAGGQGVRPTVTAVARTGARTIDVTFSEAMGAGVTVSANFTLTGTGQGSLAGNPTSVAMQSGNKYRLTWATGEQVTGGDLTVTVAGVPDLAGNALGAPASGTHAGGGAGTAPTVTAVASSGLLTIDVTFSEAMGAGVTTAANYALSGTGKGTLATNPDSVALQSGNTYRCAWALGEMFLGGDLTITVTGVRDVAGNLIGATNSRTQTGGGQGVLPTVTARAPAPGAVVPTVSVNVDVTFSEAVLGVDATDLVLSGVASVGATVGAPTNPAGNTWRFPLSTLANGALALSLAPDAGDITDQAGNGLAAVAWSLTVNAQPEIEVSGAGVVIADGDLTPSPADQTDFGARLPGESVTRTFTVRNTGNQTLDLTGTPRVLVGGAAATDFVVIVPPATPLAPGGSTTFQVRFTPSAVGLRSATLSLANNDPDEAPYDFALQGTGIGEARSVANSDMQTGVGAAPADWVSFGTAAATWATDLARSGTRSLKLVGNGAAAGWTGTAFAPPEPRPYTITIGGWSAAAGVVAPTSYTLAVDLVFEDDSTATYSANLDFSAGSHSWEYRSHTETFAKRIKVIQPSCRFQGTGAVWFDDVTVTLQRTVSRNFLADDATVTGGATPADWFAFGAGGSWATDQKHSGSRALKVVAAAQNCGWWNLPFDFAEPYPQRLTVRGWSRAEGVTATRYGLALYLVFDDNSTAWQFDGLHFAQGTHDWQEVVKPLNWTKGVKQVRVYGLLYGSGTAWFDDLEVIPEAPQTPNYRAELGTPAVGPADWTTANQGLTRATGWDSLERRSGARALKTVNATGANAFWAASTADFSAPYPTRLVLGGWSKADGVAATATVYGLAYSVALGDGTVQWYLPAALAFTKGTHDWEQREELAFFPRGVKQVRAYALLYGGTGTQTAWFDDVHATRYEPLNPNSHVEFGDPAVGPASWATAGQDLTRVTGWATDAALSGARALKLVTSTGSNAYWATTKVGFGAPYPRSFTVGAAYRADGVAATALFSLALNVEFADGTTTTSYGVYNAISKTYDLYLTGGTHDWLTLQERVTFAKDVRAITPILLLYRGTGVQTAWFDDIVVIPE